jgi:hypothetical protein
MGEASKNEQYLKDVHAEDKVLVSNIITVLKEMLTNKTGKNDPMCKKIPNGYEVEIELQHAVPTEDLLVRYDDLVNVWEVSQVRIRDIGVRISAQDKKTYVWVVVLDHKQDLIVEETTILRLRRKRKLLGMF